MHCKHSNRHVLKTWNNECYEVYDDLKKNITVLIILLAGKLCWDAGITGTQIHLTQHNHHRKV